MDNDATTTEEPELHPEPIAVDPDDLRHFGEGDGDSVDGILYQRGHGATYTAQPLMQLKSDDCTCDRRAGDPRQHVSLPDGYEWTATPLAEWKIDHWLQWGWWAGGQCRPGGCALKCLTYGALRRIAGMSQREQEGRRAALLAEMSQRGQRGDGEEGRRAASTGTRATRASRT